MLRKWVSWALRWVLAAALGAALPVQADDVSAGDAQQVRAVIQAQLAAFAADDAAGAFSYAAPGIRQMFGSPERFIEMVRQGYPVVYRPQSVGFMRPEADDDAVVQGVEMVDAGGALWIAVYRLERQPDGAWRISGCQLVRSAGRTS